MKNHNAEIFDAMVKIRRDLHRHPELSWCEERTSDSVCRVLDECGVVYRRKVAETGVVAEIPGEVTKPIIALRADMDALPIQEETGLSFASEKDNVMHACGHDGHTSMLLGAAMHLVREPSLPCPVRLIFQPAEETGLGAAAMIDDGVLEDVSMIFGGHLDRHYPTGSIVVSEGAVNASSDAFRIVISGLGGHAARPHETVDAVVVGSLLVTAIQTIVSREVNPAHPSVISVGRFMAGSAGNVIANRAELHGSIRAQDPDVREHLQNSLRRIAASVAQLHGATVETEITHGTPAVINKAPGTQVAREAALESVGLEQVKELSVANMGGEDFSHYLEQVPGCYARFGSRFTGRDNYPAHSSKFDFDERALYSGASFFRAVALAAGRYVCQTG